MIRMAIMLLVLANIVLFLWLHAPKAPERAVVTLPDPEVGRLLLTSEIETETREPVDEAAVGRVAVDPTPDQEPGAEPVQDVPVQPALVEDPAESPPGPVATDDPSGLTAEIAPLAEDAISVDLALLNERLEVVERLVNESPQAPARDTEAGSSPPDAATADIQSVSKTHLPTSEAVDDAVPEPVASSVPAADERPTADTGPPVSIAQAKPTEGAEALADVEVSEDTPQPITAGSGAGVDDATVALVDSTATVDSAEAGTPSPRPSLCARVGPLSSEEAEGLIKVLPVYIRLLSDVSEEYSEIDRYYVMIPALPTRSAGRQKLAELEAAGFSDTWLFPSGQYRNAISLGFFRYEPRATRHADRVKSAGFDAVVEPRISRREGRWLTLENVDGGAIELSLPVPETTEVSPQPCPGA